MASKKITHAQYVERVKRLRKITRSKVADLRGKLTPSKIAQINAVYNRVKPDSVAFKRLEQISPYLTKKYDLPLSDYDKRQIKSYYDELQQLSNRQHVVYRSKSAEKMRAAFDYGGHSKNLRNLKIAIIPYDGAHKPVVKITKTGKIVLSSKFVDERVIIFDDQARLVNDAFEYVSELVEDYPDDTIFSVKSALYTISGSREKPFIAEFVAKLVEEYEDNANWLIGLVANDFKNQMSLEDYNEIIKNEVKTRDKKRKAAKKKKVKKLAINV